MIRLVLGGKIEPEMTNTRAKMLEAKYFLERMNENETDGLAFNYNLSAFLAAARSVTMVMQKEFKRTPSFAQWYNGKGDEMKNDATIRFLNKRRDMTIHQQPISFHPNVRLDVSLAPIGSNKHSYSKVKWYFNDLPYLNQDVFTVCKEYIDKLEHLVQECESRFSSKEV